MEALLDWPRVREPVGSSIGSSSCAVLAGFLPVVFLDVEAFLLDSGLVILGLVSGGSVALKKMHGPFLRWIALEMRRVVSKKKQKADDKITIAYTGSSPASHSDTVRRQ